MATNSPKTQPAAAKSSRAKGARPSSRSAAPTEITVRGAREHNLKNVDLTFPRDTLTTFTGVSGSGKSSLAYHTIYQEGQRRFLESLSSYARQFLGRMEKPKVDLVEGLSPTVSIDQKSTSHSARSTVGTLTEVLDFARLLWARLGEPRCPECDAAIEAWSPDRIVDAIVGDHDGQAAMVLAPVVRERKGEYRKELVEWAQKGFVRARIDGTVRRLDEDIQLERYVYHTIELVCDRLTISKDSRSRLADAVEQAVGLGDGLCVLVDKAGENDRLFSTQRSCPNGHGALPEMEPRLFSFNSPLGACSRCDGLGETFGFAPEMLVRNPNKSIRDGALHVFNDEGRLVYGRLTMEHMAKVAKAFDFDVDTPWKKLGKKAQRIVLHGSGRQKFEFRWQKQGARFSSSGSDKIAFPGILGHLEKVYRPSRARHLDRFRAATACSDCEGARLSPAARAVQFTKRSLPDVMGQSVDDALQWVRSVKLTGNDLKIGRDILKEIERRLVFLADVGLGYLTLARRAATLSGGESQRIRLAAQVGAGLRGILYVLDEPSIGLHARDQQRLLRTLEALRDRGNTVVVVEHDEETMQRSDFLVDVGPEAGVHGGEVVSAGTPAEVMADEASMTGRYLRGELSVPMPEVRRGEDHGALQIRKATHHNLTDVDVDIPLGRFNAVTGVSGSGKSTLVHHVLVPTLKDALQQKGIAPAHCETVDGIEQVDKIVEIDQKPIGRTPRSNPATYTDVWTQVRDLFAMLPESRLREYKKGRFSFNVAGGRCEACQGAGVTTLEMNFLAPVEVVCDECQGARFHPDTLEITFKDKNVSEVLEMTIDEAAEFFGDLPKIARGLRAMQDVGLGYLKLGQPSTTLSGGEAQRVKLATELQRPATGATFYVLDEPTTGLHFQDVARLLDALQRLVDQGNTVLVIEHNLDVIRAADWLIELGPEGGVGGGQLVATGTPEKLADVDASHTGWALRAMGLGRKKAKKKSRKAGGSGASEVREKRPAPTAIAVRGARTHNLQAVDCDVPLGSFTVVTGPSGSGKSSLAFDTIFQEGQRRFLESMSTYARRFLGRMDQAPVDKLDGLGPAIAIDQKRTARSPRSTVATTTEIHDYLRLLYARIGRHHCPVHQEELVAWSPSKAAAHMIAERPGRRGYVLAPVAIPTAAEGKPLKADGKRAFLAAQAANWQQKGFVRVLVDGDERRLDDPATFAGRIPKQVHLVVDRVTIKDRTRLADALEQAQAEAERYGSGATAVVQLLADRKQGGGTDERHAFAADARCGHDGCGYTAPREPHPRWFSFNHHSGACPRCLGLGNVVVCPEELLVNHPQRALFDGAIQHKGGAFTFLTAGDGYYAGVAQVVAAEYGIDLDLPFADQPARAKHILLRGCGDQRFEVVWQQDKGGQKREWRMAVVWKGLAKQIEDWFHGKDAEAEAQDQRFTHVMRSEPCEACHGDRLQAGPRSVQVGKVRMPTLLRQTVDQAATTLTTLALDKTEQVIAKDVLKELRHRLSFLRETGLGYLTLDRSAATLSGGEAQRIRLATQLGNKLVGVLYVLDEPTVGLHPRDTERLLQTLLELRDLGNTVLAVEHDEVMVRAADHVLDIGPGSGVRGGRVVASGKPADVAASDSLTGRWLRNDLLPPPDANRREAHGHVELRGIELHNLKAVDVDVPLGVFTAVTGVSGSGKSSLVMDAMVPALAAARLGNTALADGSVDVHWRDEEERHHQLVVVDQGAIGTSPSSNPATYTKAFGPIRELFSKAPMSRQKGFQPGRFSFHVAAGRCAACEGKGQLQVEMHFLADVWVTCEICRGRRYNQETLTVEYRGKNIADVLAMDVDEALDFFGNHKKIVRPLQLLHDVGLGYLTLGQPANTFSGGEAQRIKLCAELQRRPDSHTIYVLDEPTTGLHADDVQKLLVVLDRLVERGDSVVVIEHQLDVIAAADCVIELGPEAGDEGGKIVACGTPEEVAHTTGSHTGRFLREHLERAAGGVRLPRSKTTPAKNPKKAPAEKQVAKKKVAKKGAAKKVAKKASAKPAKKPAKKAAKTTSARRRTAGGGSEGNA
ncbi:MAG: excinuclease ABC subunit UvrA [Planctomycetota bacterium]